MKKSRICFGLLICCFYSVVAEGAVFSWDFSDCEIKDILFAVSLDTGISIVPDDTVSGKVDLKFAGDDFDKAFESFLKSSRLYVKRESDVWTVSKIMVEEKDGVYSLDAYDLLPVQIVEKLSEVMDCAVTFETLPAQRISVHFKGMKDEALLGNLAKRFGDYKVLRDGGGFQFVRNAVSLKKDFNSGVVKIERVENGFSVDVAECRFSEVLDVLFSSNENKSFCLLSDGDGIIKRSVFVGGNFADTLFTLCAQNGYACTLENDVYYIYSNPDCKSELVYGKRNWRKYSLCFIKSQDFLTFLFKRIGKLEAICLPDETSFLCLASEKEAAVIETLISEVDIKLDTYVVNLKYLKPTEFLEHLPPAVDRASLFVADDSERIYFKGTAAAYKNLCEQLEVCDRPLKRISYDLLILQYDETRENAFSSSFGVKRLSAGDRMGASAVLGSVMGFNLNVVTSFGLTFAADLQTSIEENKTRVFADTTLHGVSGQEIHFQNTNTYRYRDNNVDPQTGLPVYSGVTREIASGIKIDVLGWVSGDGLITSKVTASVSRQGNDTSALTGNPPPTSEKVVTTEVCGKSGEPVVLSGLIQNAESEQEKRSPVLSKIPVLGNLFKSKNTIKENSQMVIYLVPHVDNQKSIKKQISFEWIKNKMDALLESYKSKNELSEKGAVND